MQKRETKVLDIRNYGANSITGAIFKALDLDAEKMGQCFGWDKPKSDFEWLIIVPEKCIDTAKEECAEIQLKSFTILSNKGMIIGG